MRRCRDERLSLGRCFSHLSSCRATVLMFQPKAFLAWKPNSARCSSWCQVPFIKNIDVWEHLKLYKLFYITIWPHRRTNSSFGFYGLQSNQIHSLHHAKERSECFPSPLRVHHRSMGDISFTFITILFTVCHYKTFIELYFIYLFI